MRKWTDKHYPGPVAEIIPPHLEKHLCRLQAAVTPKELAHTILRLIQVVAPVKIASVLYRVTDYELPLLFALDPLSLELYQKWIRMTHDQDLWLRRTRHTINPSNRVVRHTDHTPYRTYLASNFYRKDLRHYGIHYGAAVLVWEEKSWLMLVGLLRSKEQGDFLDSELAVLRALHPQIEAAVKRVTRINKQALHVQSLHSLVGGLSHGLLFLDWDLKTLFYNREAHRLSHLWIHGPWQGQRLKPSKRFRPPPEIIKECQRIKSIFPQKKTKLDLRHALVHPRWPELNSKIDVIHSSVTPLIRGAFIVHLDSPATLPAQRPRRDLGSLSPGERATMRLACEGKTNREIAEVLHKSPATIKNQLHSIFRKLGVKRRMELVAR